MMSKEQFGFACIIIGFVIIAWETWSVGTILAVFFFIGVLIVLKHKTESTKED